MTIQEAIEHAREVAERCATGNKECAYQHDKLADWLEELKAVKTILGNEYDILRLRELIEADRDGRCVVLPKVDNDSMKSFIDSLEDIFSEWSYEDKSVGLFGMSDGERELASALMNALKGENK